MFWFERQSENAVYCDNRQESFDLKDSSTHSGSRSLKIHPDVVSDFTELPFMDNIFDMVVFDPPHLLHAGRNSWLAKKYGKLGLDWREDVRKGFSEGFRVLKPLGSLIFKWNETDIPVSHVLALTLEKPVVGNRCGKLSKSHWLVFLKA